MAGLVVCMSKVAGWRGLVLGRILGLIVAMLREGRRWIVGLVGAMESRSAMKRKVTKQGLLQHHQHLPASVSNKGPDRRLSRFTGHPQCGT